MTPSLKHDLALLGLQESDTQSGEFQHRTFNREALKSCRLFARDVVRAATQRELTHADKYDHLRATQAVIMVKFTTPQGAELHVMNGNNRVHLFGNDKTNPNNKPLPVCVFESPEAFERLLSADAWSNYGRARRFNFNN